MNTHGVKELSQLNWISLLEIKRLKPSKNGIYVIRNNKNGLLYVGLTHGGFFERLRGHVHVALYKHMITFEIYKAMREHGIESFDVAIVEEFSDIKVDLNTLEQHYISKFNCVLAGYNMTFGGEGTLGYVHDAKSRKKISQKRKGTPCPEILKAKLRKPVYQIDIESGEIVNEFRCVTDAFKATKILNIGNCCKGTLKTAGGYRWQFVHEEHKNTVKWRQEVKEKMKERWYTTYNKHKPIHQIDIQTNQVINTFSSVKAAHAETKICNIDACARGVRKSAGGYLWRYVDDLTCANSHDHVVQSTIDIESTDDAQYKTSAN